jgi:hypothetical protein
MAHPTKSVTKRELYWNTCKYMSPEQSKENPADARSDILHLGRSLRDDHGQTAFTGKSRTSLIASF